MKILILAMTVALVGCEDRTNEYLRREVSDLYKQNQVLREQVLNNRMDDVKKYESLQLDRLKGDKIKASKVYKDGCLSLRNFLKRQSIKLEGDQWDYCDNMKLYEGYLYFNGKEYAYKH